MSNPFFKQRFSSIFFICVQRIIISTEPSEWDNICFSYSSARRYMFFSNFQVFKEFRMITSWFLVDVVHLLSFLFWGLAVLSWLLDLYNITLVVWKSRIIWKIYENIKIIMKYCSGNTVYFFQKENFYHRCWPGFTSL